MEAEISLEVLGDLSHQALERQLADEQLGGLLVATNLPQSHSARPEEKQACVVFFFFYPHFFFIASVVVTITESVTSCFNVETHL